MARAWHQVTFHKLKFDRDGTLLLLPLLTLFCGCPSLTPRPDQAPIHELTAKRTQSPYLLYVPSVYHDRRNWPVIVLCHGTWPWDTADLEMREWAHFGEENGIIIAAPYLQGARGDFPPPPAEQIALQQQDEEAILDVVTTLKNRYMIDESEIFMTGWSAGAYAILHTGLRNPDVFRALFIRQGSFDERFLELEPALLDRWQPIQVVIGQRDIIKKQTEDCVQWLKDRGLFVNRLEITGTHRRIDPETAWQFFRKTVKERPWIRIRYARRAQSSDLAYRFWLKTSPALVRQRWYFGDGTTSDEPSPTHNFKSGGRYDIKVHLTLKGGHTFTRTRSIIVQP